ATVRGSDVVISGVTAGCIGSVDCSAIEGGFGAAGQFGGALSLDRFQLDATALCGVVVGDSDVAGAATSVDLSEGTISTSPIGACVQVDGFDGARLRDRVRYVDVGIPLQATSYALPDVVPGA